MGCNFELCEAELIKEEFEKVIPPFEIVGNSESSLKRSYKLGTAVNNEDENDIKLLLQYRVDFEQKKKDTDELISKTMIEYIFVFEEEDNTIINLIQNNDLSEEKVKELVTELDKKAYPYLKEHIEAKYKKANLPIDLPFNASKETK